MNNLLAAGERAGVRHQVILSIVGVDQVPQLDYYRAKTLQEDLLRQGPAPYSIVRATQFFEFMNTVVSETFDDTTVRLPSTRLQPIAAADVAGAVAEVSTGTPLRGTRNFAGPDVFPLDELGRVTLAATTRPACSRASPPTCSPRARTHTWPPRTTRTGSRRPANRAAGGLPWLMIGRTVLMRPAKGCVFLKGVILR